MSFVANEDMVAYRVGGEIVCGRDGCMTAEETAALEEADIICQIELEEADGIYFCDRCKKQI